MNIEEDISSPLSAQHLFQKKSDINTSMKFQTVELISNHFVIDFENLRFLHSKDREQFEKNPKEIEDPVPKDSRVLTNDILRANRGTLNREFGNFFNTGQTIFTFGKADNIKDQYLFDGHDDYIMCLNLVAKKQDFVNLQSHENQKKQLLRFLNARLKYILKTMNYYEFGRLKKYYNFSDKVNVPEHHVEIYKGFNTAFDMYESGLRLLIDNSCRILRTKNLWQEFLEEAHIEKDDYQSIRQYFVGKNCVASYGNNRRYRIDDVKFDLKVSDPFPDPTFASYADYFKEKYKKNIHYKDQYMLVSKTTYLKKVGDHQFEKVENLVDLIPELLQGTGLTDTQKKSFYVMKDIGRTTIQNPQHRFDQIYQLAEDINNTKTETFKFNIDLKKNVIKGYRLTKPRLKADDKFQPDRDRINIRGVYKKMDIKDWVLFYDYKHGRDVNRIIDNLKKSSSRYNLRVSEPIVVKELPRRIQARDLPKLYEHKIKEPKLLFFLCSQMTANFLYKDSKGFFQKIGIPSQFYTSYNPKRDQLSKYGNLILQELNKIGGSAWVYQDAPQDTVVIGIDKMVLKDNRLVAGCVAQMGSYFRRSFAALEMVKSQDDDIHQAISRLIIQTCQYYKKKYDVLPRDVVVYRQCTGARDLQKMIEKEILITKEIINDQFRNEKIIPKLNVILVTKKISDKFVEKTQRGLINPEGIAVVDDVVMPDRINFYLIAQKVNQGTATPTHYQVVYNQSELSLQQLTKLSYDLTYMYLNWLGPVRVPSPLQYVEKLSALIHITQETKISKNIRSLLFFL